MISKPLVLKIFPDNKHLMSYAGQLFRIKMEFELEILDSILPMIKMVIWDYQKSIEQYTLLRDYAKDICSLAWLWGLLVILIRPPKWKQLESKPVYIYLIFILEHAAFDNWSCRSGYQYCLVTFLNNSPFYSFYVTLNFFLSITTI